MDSPIAKIEYGVVRPWGDVELPARLWVHSNAIEAYGGADAAIQTGLNQLGQRSMWPQDLQGLVEDVAIDAVVALPWSPNGRTRSMDVYAFGERKEGSRVGNSSWSHFEHEDGVLYQGRRVCACDINIHVLAIESRLRSQSDGNRSYMGRAIDLDDVNGRLDIFTK